MKIHEYQAKEIIKSFHNSYSLWNKESKKFKEHIYKTQKRVVELPYTPSAELYSLMFLILLSCCFFALVCLN